MTTQTWNAGLYSGKHAFVWQMAADLIPLLHLQPGERVLDLGCGTGQLTAQLAATGAEVLGVDSSPAMIEQAQAGFPHIPFQPADARSLNFLDTFDAVFSNATLHWVHEADAVARSVSRALKRKGRFVAEFGGAGNVAIILQAVASAASAQGATAGNPWYFPTIAQYTAILEANGLEPVFATLFDRDTPLDDPQRGLRDWIQMFGASFLHRIPDREKFLRDMESSARPLLFRDGKWHADYRRLRIAAVKAKSNV